MEISPSPLHAAFFEGPRSKDASIFWSVRLPRAVLAAIVGAGLAASGTTLQGVLRNPLADPFVLGVSGGAALGATIAVALGLATVGEVAPGLGGMLARSSAPAFFAILGAAASMLLVLVVSRGHGGRTPYAALLIGVVFNAFASAVITLIKTLSNPTQLEAILYWLVGNLGYEYLHTLVLSALLEVGAIGVMLGAVGAAQPALLGR